LARYKHLILLFILLAGLSIPGLVQQPYFEEENFSSPASAIKHVMAIGADKNNCLWFGTQAGVYRYDGSRFRHYSVLNTPQLQFERIAYMSLIRGDSGIRWCLTDSKGNSYEIDSESHIRPFAFRNNENEQLAYRMYDVSTFNTQNGQPDTSLGDLYETFITYPSKQVFLVQQDGVVSSLPLNDYLKAQKRTLIYQPAVQRHGRHPVTQGFSFGNTFYIISGNDILRCGGQPGQNKAVVLKGDILADKQAIDPSQVKVFNTPEPGVIIMAYAGGVYEISEDTSANTLHTRLLVRYYDQETPATVYYSAQQQIFIGYYYSRGLVFYRPRQFKLLSWDDPVSSPIDYYYSLTPSNDGFITLNKAGLIRLGLNGEKKMLSSGDHVRYFLYKNDDGDIWFEGSNWTIYCHEQKTGKTTPLFRLSTNDVFNGVHRINDSTYYILSSGALRKVYFQNNKLTKEKIVYRAPAGIELNFLFSPGNNRLWLGSDRGLFQYDPATDAVTAVAGLENAYMRAVCKLGPDNFLVGTYDKGIFQYNGKNWMPLNAGERKMPSSAHGFIIDKNTSSLWVSSNDGLLRLPLEPLMQPPISGELHISFRHFTNFGSLVPAEFNGSSNASAAKVSDSAFAFANAKGLVVFNPFTLLLSPLPVNVLVENAAGSNEVNVKGNHAEFYPVVPYYGNLQELEIEYYLSNADDTWHKLSPNSVISYSNLSPGKHSLQFRVRHQHELQGREIMIDAIEFFVPYKWHQRLWAKISIAALVIVLLIGLHTIRIWYLRKRKRELEQTVQAKTRELTEINENLLHLIGELSVSEASLKQSNFLKDEYYAVLTHDLRSPLKFLSFNISQLLERYGELNDETMKKGLFIAYECANDAHKLIDEFVYWIRENENQLEAQPAPVVIHAVVEDAKKIYEFNMETNRNAFVNDVDKGLVFVTDPKMLFIILRNAIDNANKYSSAAAITVSARQRPGGLEVTIADTGRGISEEMIAQLMSLQQDNVQLTYKQRKSLGFYIMAMLIKKLGGHYIIDSVKEKGTTLQFIIPELKPVP
jgi:signal transduction histidine kinase